METKMPTATPIRPNRRSILDILEIRKASNDVPPDAWFAENKLRVRLWREIGCGTILRIGAIKHRTLVVDGDGEGRVRATTVNLLMSEFPCGIEIPLSWLTSEHFEIVESYP